MAGLEIQIGADSSDLNKKIKEAELALKELSQVKLEQIRLGLDTKEINGNIASVKKSLNDLKTTSKDTGTAIGGMAPKVADGGNALMQFSRIAQDAPYGIIGIGNNITSTVEAFGYLKNETGSTGGALKALAGSIMGSGGILLAVSLVTTALTYMSQNGITVGDVFNKLTGNFDGYASALKKVNEEAYKDDGVKSAIANVNELKINIDLAKKGFLDKNQVVKQYNETIGKTTGLVDNLDQAEKMLVRNGDAYIKMTLYKAAANLALEEAAKKTLVAEETRVKKLKDFASVTDDLSSATKMTTGTGDAPSVEDYKALKDQRAKAQKKRKDEEIKINQDAANKNISIAKKFQSQAAKIATEFNFNLFNDTKAPSVKKVKEQKVFFTPQVSGVQSSLDTSGLIDVNTIAVQTGAIDKFGNKIKELPGIIRTSMGEVNIAFDTSGQGMLEALNKLNEDMNTLISGSIAETLGSLGTVIGDALTNGGNVLGAIGSVLLQSLGKFLSDMGGLLIQYGTMAVIKGKLDLAIATGGPAAIAAGFAAIGVGIALKAIGGAIASKAQAGNSSSGRSVSTGASVSSPTSSTGGGGGSSFQGGTVVFEISGQSLIGVLSNTLDKNRRLGGSLSF